MGSARIDRSMIGRLKFRFFLDPIVLIKRGLCKKSLIEPLPLVAVISRGCTLA